MNSFVRRTVLLITLLVACTSCGLPDDGRVEPIDDAKVPYHLLDKAPAPSRPSAPRAHPSAAEQRLYWVTGRDELAATTATQKCASETYSAIRALLHGLASGPSGTARAAGMSTALTPDTELRLIELSGRTAVVEVRASTPLPADRLPVAVGQIVLTVTSAPGVDRVVLRDKGQRLEIPVPGGALTGSPVSARDYASLIRRKDRRHPQPTTGGCE